MKRNTELDKKDYPIPYGYAWAPAVIDDFPLCQLKCTAANANGSDKVKKVKGNTFYQKSQLGRKLTYNALRGDLRTLGVKDISYPGAKFIKATKFSLYNQADITNASESGTKIRNLVRANSYVLQDSGGFQLVSGVEDFIDPAMVARKHYLYADSGVSLDLPVSGINDKKFALAAAKMLVANTRIILDNSGPAKVMNVCHGATLEIRSAFIDEVVKEPGDSLCIAGLRKGATQHENDFDRSSPVAFASHILLALLKTEKLYQHYHVLGVATPWQMAIIALAANVFQKVITSDSASHSLAAKSGILVDYAGQQAFKLAGRQVDSYSPNYCSCPMCVELKDYLWYKIGASWMPSIHNGYALLRSAETFDHLAKMVIHHKLESTELTKHLTLNLRKMTVDNMHSFQRAVNLVLTTKSASSLRNLPAGGKPKGLFADTAASAIPQRHLDILRSYEAYHGKKWL